MDFHEVQHAPRPVRILLVVVMSITAVLGGLITFLQWQTDPSHSIAAIVMMVLLIVALPSGLVLWLMMVRQHVTINAEGISVYQKGVMLRARHWPWSAITSVHLRPLNAFGEFGGWGVRYSLQGRWGYILDGAYGLDVTLAKGKPRTITIVDGQGAREALDLHAPSTVVGSHGITQS